MENTTPHHIHETELTSLSESDSPLYRADQFDPRDSVGNLIRLALSSLQAQIDREMNPHDLTAMQWQPLYLVAMGRAQTAADLAREMQVDTGATTRMIDRLAAKGLLTRERSSSDRRLVKLVLTEAGQTAAREVPEVLCRSLNSHLDGFSAAELDQLKHLLTRVITNGQSHRPDALPV